jgi:hypothetical protein
VTDGPARRLAEAFGRRGLAAPARLLADAHRPLQPLIADLGAALGPLLKAAASGATLDARDLADDPGGLDRLIEELDRRAPGSSHADSR